MFENLAIPDHITSLKIDIGLSYNVPQSQIWLENDPNVFVFGFEPNSDSVSIIQAGNIVKKDACHGTPIKDEYLHTRFLLFPIALANVSEPTEMDFYQMANDGGTSSLYRPTDSSIGPVKATTQVPVYALKHFFDALTEQNVWQRFPYIDYIKIDAQGADYQILLSAGDYLKEHVVYVTAEPEYMSYADCGENNTENITRYLESQGFERIRHPNTSDPTFLNKKFAHLKDAIFIWQRG